MSKITRVEILLVDLVPKVKRVDAIQSASAARARLPARSSLP